MEDKTKRRKYSSKGRAAPSRRRESAEEDRVDRTSFADAVSMAVDQTVIVMRNSALATAGGSGNEPLVRCSDVYLNLEDTLGLKAAEGLEPFIGPSLDEFCRAFSVSRGYSTSVTFDVLRGYLNNAVYAAAYLITALRIYNCQSLTTLNGLAVNYPFTYRTPNVFTQIWGTNACRGVGGGGVTENTAISNAVWAQTYLSQLPKIRLPESLLLYLIKMFGIYYSLANHAGTGADAYLAFFPFTSTATLANTSLVNFLARITAIDALLAATPDLFSITDQLGWRAETIQSIDFSRDLKGQTFFAAVDEDIVTLLRNSLAIGADAGPTGFSPDSDIATLFTDYTSESNFMSYNDTAAFPLSTTGLAFMHRVCATTDVTAPLIFAQTTKYVESDGTTAYSTIFPGCVDSISWAGVISDADKTLVLASLIRTFRNWESSIGISIPYSYAFAITGTVPADVVVTPSIASTVTVSHASYYFDVAEADVFTRTAMASLIFGAEFREELQRLLLSLPRASSGIRY